METFYGMEQKYFHIFSNIRNYLIIIALSDTYSHDTLVVRYLDDDQSISDAG